MFSLFTKKVLLKDVLSDVPDIHNHILPGLDDGAENMEASLKIIKKFKDLGMKKFIATPHIMNDYYPNSSLTIQNALTGLRKALQKEGMNDVQIEAAAEYMMDQAFLELLEKEDLLCLYENKVLVEMSYFQPPINLTAILFKLQTRGYCPVLAHPERYAFFHSKSLNKYQDLKSRGCFFQLNILSVTGHYGTNIKEAAFSLLDQGMIDFVGTDTHQVRHLEKLLGSKIPQKRMNQLRPIISKTKETFMPAFS